MPQHRIRRCFKKSYLSAPVLTTRIQHTSSNCVQRSACDDLCSLGLLGMSRCSDLLAHNARCGISSTGVRLFNDVGAFGQALTAARRASIEPGNLKWERAATIGCYQSGGRTSSRSNPLAVALEPRAANNPLPMLGANCSFRPTLVDEISATIVRSGHRFLIEKLGVHKVRQGVEQETWPVPQRRMNQFRRYPQRGWSSKLIPKAVFATTSCVRNEFAGWIRPSRASRSMRS
jgi:hypothetical protein